jgi:hypothetical protein
MGIIGSTWTLPLGGGDIKAEERQASDSDGSPETCRPRVFARGWKELHYGCGFSLASPRGTVFIVKNGEFRRGIEHCGVGSRRSSASPRMRFSNCFSSCKLLKPIRPRETASAATCVHSLDTHRTILSGVRGVSAAIGRVSPKLCHWQVAYMSL